MAFLFFPDANNSGAPITTWLLRAIPIHVTDPRPGLHATKRRRSRTPSLRPLPIFIMNFQTGTSPSFMNSDMSHQHTIIHTDCFCQCRSTAFHIYCPRRIGNAEGKHRIAGTYPGQSLHTTLHWHRAQSRGEWTYVHSGWWALHVIMCCHHGWCCSRWQSSDTHHGSRCESSRATGSTLSPVWTYHHWVVILWTLMCSS